MEVNKLDGRDHVCKEIRKQRKSKIIVRNGSDEIRRRYLDRECVEKREK